VTSYKVRMVERREVTAWGRESIARMKGGKGRRTAGRSYRAEGAS